MDYYRGLLALRAAFPRLGSTDRHAPEALQFFALEQPLVGWMLPAVWGDGAAWSALCVFYNPTDTTCTVSLPAGQWKLLSDGASSSLWRGQSRVFTGKAYGRACSPGGSCRAATEGLQIGGAGKNG